MKHEIERIGLGYDSNEVGYVCIYRGGKLFPECYGETGVSNASIRRIERVVRRKNDRFRITQIPSGNLTGWIAVRRH